MMLLLFQKMMNLNETLSDFFCLAIYIHMKLFILLFFFTISNSSSAFFLNNIFTFFRNRNQETIQKKCSCPYYYNKKLIILTPGGLYGFYTLGVSSFIKDHYNLTDCVFSGSSAGSWNSLFLSYQGDKNITQNMLQLISHVQNQSSIHKIQTSMKCFLLCNFNTSDFDLTKSSLGVTTFTGLFSFKLILYTHFYDLEDFINCCMASSHIPFISGKLFFRYKKLLSFDGGFSRYPYQKYPIPSLVISPDMWNSSYTNSSGPFGSLTLSKNKPVNFTELFIQGYNDTKNNKYILDSIFTPL